MTPVSSISYYGVIIGQPMDKTKTTIQIALGHPSLEAFTGIDPRTDPRIMEALEQSQKLKQLAARLFDRSVIMKKIFYICFLSTFVLASCAPGSGITLPPDMTLVPGTDIPQQVATYVSNALTQTAIPPVTSTPISGEATTPVGSEATVLPTPGGVTPPFPTPMQFPYQTLYQSPALGIQFVHPSAWYRSETNGGVTLTSFDPSNPPHKLEWTYETTSMQFGFKVFITHPAFDTWVEGAKQAAQTEGWSIYTEERFSIANQPAARLSLVSGSGGMLNRVLIYELNGRYFEINIEGNYNNNLAKTVLDSIQPSYEGVLKPPDSNTPAAGICADAQGDPVNIILGIDTSGMPLAGRCVVVTPAQRIKLINRSVNPIKLRLMEYPIALPVGGEILLDKPVGQYLALGVHLLNAGPELWVKDGAAATAPPPIVEYNNFALGYKLNLPGNWIINETGGANKEVIFSPPYAEAFIAYLSVSRDSRTLDQVINYFAQNMGALNVVREDITFNGYPAVKYTYTSGRNEYFIPYGNQLFLIATDRPNDSAVQSMLMTFRFTASPQPVTYDATMADNGRTFIMNIGDKLRINLDYGYTWSMASISDPTVLAGAGDGYFAFVSGTTTLTMTGDPECLNLTPPCGMPSILYSITVIVQ